MMAWEKSLASLSREGWSYAYVKCIDLEEGADIFYVSIRRGDQTLTSLRPTMEEAVQALSQLAESGIARLDDKPDLSARKKFAGVS